jgi:hypothetical protein
MNDADTQRRMRGTMTRKSKFEGVVDLEKTGLFDLLNSPCCRQVHQMLPSSELVYAGCQEISGDESGLGSFHCLPNLPVPSHLCRCPEALASIHCMASEIQRHAEQRSGS